MLIVLLDGQNDSPTVIAFCDHSSCVGKWLCARESGQGASLGHLLNLVASYVPMETIRSFKIDFLNQEQ